MSRDGLIEIGTLESGYQVLYKRGAINQVNEDWETSLGITLERIKTESEDYVYYIIDKETEEEIDCIEVSPNEWGRAETRPEEVIDTLEEKYGQWDEFTAAGLIEAYQKRIPGSDVGYVDSYPDELDTGEELVGIYQYLHDFAIPLYFDGDKLIPYAKKNHELVRFPEEESVTQECTFDVDEYGGLDELIHEFEQQQEWLTDGYPHYITEDRAVAGQTVQVAHSFRDALNYPKYYVENGSKRRIR